MWRVPVLIYIQNIAINDLCLDESTILKELQNIIGELTYLPPKYSAKNIDGKRAYEMARDGIEFDMKRINQIYDVKNINYNHPFISFDIMARKPQKLDSS